MAGVRVADMDGSLLLPCNNGTLEAPLRESNVQIASSLVTVLGDGGRSG